MRPPNTKTVYTMPTQEQLLVPELETTKRCGARIGGANLGQFQWNFQRLIQSPAHSVTEADLSKVHHLDRRARLPPFATIALEHYGQS